MPLCKKLLGSEVKPEDSNKDQPVQWYDIIEKLTGKDPLVCGKCGKGRLIQTGEFPRRKRLIFLTGGIP